MTSLYCFILLIKCHKYIKYIYDNKSYLDQIHFESLYPTNSKQSQEEKEFSLKRQKSIGICVNFNNNPDVEGNTLNSIINSYNKIHEHIVILTPSSFDKLSLKNIELLNKSNVKSIKIENSKLNNSYSSIFNDKLNEINTRINHIQCFDGRSGQLQHKCMIICAQFYQYLKDKYSNLRGILYLSDDLYFNFAYVFTHPERFPLDEIWATPSTQIFDFNRDINSPYQNQWWWWKNRPQFWHSFRQFFLSKSENHKKYQQIFEILYGPNKCLSIANADLLYLPFADQQLTSFINITNKLIELFPSDIFCEIIYSVIIDLTMAETGHWPFQHDQYLFNSSINRLNNLILIKQMEKNNSIKSARDPYSLNNNYRQRPSLFNPYGFIWDHHRNNQQLFYNAIFKQTLPLQQFLKPWIYNTEFIHPLKLSNPNHWSSQLWNEGLQLQIEQLKTYQLYKIKV